MFCDFVRHPRSKLAYCADRLRKERPQLESAVARHLLDTYRRRRTMLTGPLTALVSSRTRARIIVRGEIEHRLGLNVIVPVVRDAALRLAARLRLRKG